MPHGQRHEPGEQPEPPDRVVRRLQLEEEGFARADRREATAARLPEVDLGDLGPGAQELIPAVVCRGDEPMHHQPILAAASASRKTGTAAAVLPLVAVIRLPRRGGRVPFRRTRKGPEARPTKGRLSGPRDAVAA